VNYPYYDPNQPRAHTRSLMNPGAGWGAPPSGGMGIFGGAPFPGGGGSGDWMGGPFPSPFAGQGPSAGGGSGGGFSMSSLKGIIDRLGGLDGIMGTMSKVQKIVQSFQQMSPMLKLIMGSFLGKAKTTDAGQLPDPPVRRRRNRRRPGSKAKRRPAAKVRSNRVHTRGRTR